MVGIALVSPSAAVCLGQARLCDGIDFQNILSLLDIVSESIAEGYICAALSCLGIFFLRSLGTGKLTFPDFYTKKESPLTPSEHVFQQDGSAWLREAFEVYFPSLMDKKEGLPFRLAGLLASHNPAHLSSELYRRLLKKMVSAPSLSIAFAEGSLLTNYENQDKRVTAPIPGSYPIDSSKFASKLMGLEKEITKPLVNASALVIVNEEGRIRSKKPDQWGLVAATRDYDDEGGDDSDEEVEGEDDNQGDDDDDKENDDDDDDDDDEEPGGNGEASDGGDEGKDDEESEEDDDDDEDDDEDEEDDENEEDEEEPPKKKKK